MIERAELLISLLRARATDAIVGPQAFDFGQFSSDELKCLLTTGFVEHFQADDSVIGLDDHSTDLYILLEGQVEVRVPITQDRTKMIILGPASVVGEVAFLDGEPRSAEVIARSSCSLLRISREAAENLEESYPSASVRLFQQLGTILGLRLRRLDLFDATEIARDEERKALAIELHDETMAELTALTMEVAILGSDRGLADGLRHSLEETRERVKSINVRLREIVKGVYPAELISLGLVRALTSYLDNLTLRTISNPTTISITFEVSGFASERLPEEIEADLYRLLQQSVSNLIQHSRSSTVRIELSWSKSYVTLEVADNGIGFDVSNPKNDLRNGHFGLANIRNRIERHGGEARIISADGKGTSISGWIPLTERPDVPSDAKVLSFVLPIEVC